MTLKNLRRETTGDSKEAFDIQRDLRRLLRGKRPLGRPRRKWEDNVRMNLKEIGVNTKNWIDSTLCECGIEPPGSTTHGVSYLVS